MNEQECRISLPMQNKIYDAEVENTPSNPDASSFVFGNGRFEMVEKLGSGSFGYLFKVFDRLSKKFCAAKIENSRSKGHNLLAWEYTIYNALNKVPGYPEVVWFGFYGKRSVIVMQLCGADLDHMFALCSNKFTLKTVLMIGLQLLPTLKSLHDKSYVHRDLKPANIVVGYKAPKSLYIIDFGLTRSFKDPKTNVFHPPKFKASMAGTPRFASLAAHNGTSQSPKDDLESFLYVLIYFLKGKLPWQGLRVRKEGRGQKIEACKRNTPLEVVCSGLPSEFKDLLSYSRSLSYYENVNYKHVENTFWDLMSKNNFENDLEFDWCKLNLDKDEIEEFEEINENENLEKNKKEKEMEEENENEVNKEKEIVKEEIKGGVDIELYEQVVQERDYYKNEIKELDFNAKKMKLEIEALKMQIDVYKKFWEYK